VIVAVLAPVSREISP